MRRLLPLGLWLAVTTAATATVWTATSVVAADVTDRPASVLAHHDVVTELASGSSPAKTTPTTTAPRADGFTSTVPSHVRDPTSPDPGAPASAVPPAPPRPAVAIAPSPPRVTPTTLAGTPPTTRPLNSSPPAPAPPAQPTPRPTATYSTSGGVVRVACDGYFIELVSAIPNNGYAVDVVARGPANVEVHFIGFGQDLSVKAFCFGQPIRYYDKSAPRQAPTST